MNLKRTLMFMCLAGTMYTADAQSLRAPAYPLVTHDPYFSIWSFTDTLYNEPTRHWTGKPHSLLGLARIDGQTYRFLGEATPAYNTLMATSETKPASWQYAFEAPAQGWEQPGFDDKAWKTGRGPFTDNSSEAGTTWKTPELWARRSFNLAAVPGDKLALRLNHDDNIEVYINGVQAYSREGWTGNYKEYPLSPAAKAALKPGRNVIAIHIKNTAGGAFLDAGLLEEKPGPSLHAASQTACELTATQTKYTFDCGPVQLGVVFTSPLLTDKLEVMTRPASYITFTATSRDGKPHQVSLLLGAGANIAVNKGSEAVKGERLSRNGLDILKTGTQQQNILGTKGDDVRIDWGYLYTAVPQNVKHTATIAPEAATVAQFSKSGALSLPVTANAQAPAANPLLLATSLDLGNVGGNAVDRHIILAYDDIYSVELFGQRLRAWWRRDAGMTAEKMLQSAEKDYTQLIADCKAFDQSFQAKMQEAGGQSYTELATLAYRQSIAAHKTVQGPNGKLLFFSKENFSNGSIGTVDITYPSAPLYLLYNPLLLKGMMEPIFYYAESGRWKKPFAAHDVGTYPLANGQTYGEDMPVEESGNMLILTTAIAAVEKNARYAAEHWNTLTTWAQYLEKEGLDPSNQLCTDDFAGHLAHNANLSIKAILGLAGYGKLAAQLGKHDIAEKYTRLAKEMAAKWVEMAKDGDHYSLTFDKKGTWSQKYNLVWDELLQLNVFPTDIAKTEIKYYLQKQESYGLPLDSRKTYTKSDWILWTATMADEPAAFDALIKPVYKFATETPDRIPLSDWHETTNGKSVGFRARSVVGGYFMPALKKQLK
jgi:hypothetical protein